MKKEYLQPTVEITVLQTESFLMESNSSSSGDMSVNDRRNDGTIGWGY